jgi:hypothetical protein
VLAPATLAALLSTRAIPDRDVFYVAHPIRFICCGHRCLSRTVRQSLSRPGRSPPQRGLSDLSTQSPFVLPSNALFAPMAAAKVRYQVQGNDGSIGETSFVFRLIRTNSPSLLDDAV